MGKNNVEEQHLDILVDTREQKPLFKGTKIKLDEGDYNVPELLDHIIIERKSPGDLYGSVIQGHVRFADEINRAKLKGLKIYVVVECTEKDFYAKKWAGSYYTQLKGSILAKIICTMTHKYQINFVWCKNRAEAKQRIIDIIITNKKLYNK